MQGNSWQVPDEKNKEILNMSKPMFRMGHKQALYSGFSKLDYENLENNCLYRAPTTVTAHIWLWDKTDHCWYRQWMNQQIVLTRKRAMWYPYAVRGRGMPVFLRKLPVAEGWGRLDYTLTD